MNWEKEVRSSGLIWTCGRLVVKQSARQYRLTHPDLPTLKFSSPDVAMKVAGYLVVGGLKP